MSTLEPTAPVESSLLLERFRDRLASFLPEPLARVRVLAAVSGGADSTALLHLCRRLRGEEGLALEAAHFHHHLRGASADADAEFVRRLAVSCSLPFHRGDWDPGDRSGLRREDRNLPAAARRARYDFLAKVAKDNRCHAILTAHHAGDLAETVLLNLARGGGDGAYSGIGETGEWEGVSLIRPLLSENPVELRSFLAREGLEHREDPSNSDTDYRRNFARHEILNRLERVHPEFVQEIGRRWESQRLRETSGKKIAGALLEKALHREGEFLVRREDFEKVSMEDRFLVLRELLRASGGGEDRSQGWSPTRRDPVASLFRMLDSGGMGSVNFPDGWRVRVEERVLIFESPRQRSRQRFGSA
jgi:tRNA(Ile)-lysidine synthetase-like protein